MFVDRMNMEILSLQVNENLRFYRLNEMYDKGNYSNADAYLNTVSQHVSSFGKALSGYEQSITNYWLFYFLIYSDVQMVLFWLGCFDSYIPNKVFFQKENIISIFHSLLAKM